MVKGTGWIRFVSCVVVYTSCTLEIGITSVSRESKEPRGPRWGTTLYLWVYGVVLDGLHRHYYFYCRSRASSTAVSRESSEIPNRNRLSSMFIVDIVYSYWPA